MYKVETNRESYRSHTPRTLILKLQRSAVQFCSAPMAHFHAAIDISNFRQKLRPS